MYKKHLEEDLAGCLHLQLGVGRIYDGLNDLNSSIDFYKASRQAFQQSLRDERASAGDSCGGHGCEALC